MIHRTVTLVATPAAIDRYFPGSDLAIKPGIVSAPFPIDPASCKTALGRLLAENIPTTRFDDDLSRVRILSPQTSESRRIKELAKRLAESQRVESREAADKVYAGLTKFAADRMAALKNDWSGFNFSVINFNWPVFWSRVASNARTPEAYFDECGKMMSATGGVVLSVGTGGVQIPDALAHGMAVEAGGGVALLERYRRQIEIADAGQVGD